jgi:enterochelin esterase-like enzyme
MLLKFPTMGAHFLTFAAALAAVSFVPLMQAREGGPPGATFDETRGIWSCELPSEFLSEPSQLEILLPSKMEPGKRYPVIYLLPVGKRGGEFGDGMAEAIKDKLADKLGAICVEPTFKKAPWFGNHATDPQLRQDDFMAKTLVPFMDTNFPTLAKPEGRALLGFSKSGWGATTLLLRHPDVFGYAVAWDVPFMIDGSKPDWGPMGLKVNYGTKEAMVPNTPTVLLRAKGAELGDKPRIIIASGKAWTPQTKQFKALMDELKVPHVYRDDLIFQHRWDSGWFPAMTEELGKLLDQAPAQ